MTAEGRSPGHRPSISPRAVYREIYEVYRRHWRFLVPAAIVILLPQAIANGFVDGFEIAGVDDARDLALVIAIPITIGASVFGEALYAGIAAFAVLEWRAGHPVPGIRRLVASLPLGTLIVVDLLLSLGAAIGSAFLLIPGIVLVAYLGLAPAMVKIERRGVRDSFRRSAQLVSGQFWRVLTILVTLMVLTDLATRAITLPFHGRVLETAGHLAAESVLEPVQALATVIVALALLARRGELPEPDQLALTSAGPA